MSKRSLVIALTLTAIAVACGVSISSDTACTDQSKAQCTQLDACWNGQGVVRSYADVATCQSRLKQQCLTSLSAPGTGNTATTVESCSSALGGETCSDYFNGNPPSACQTRAGTGANGSPCVFNAQCASTFCSIAGHAQCGVCADLPHVGDQCDTQGCAPGQSCVLDYDNVTHVCVQPVQASQPCFRTQPCQADLTCVGNQFDGGGGNPGTCMASISITGQQCDSAQIVAPTCDAHSGLFCTPRTNYRDGGYLLGTCEAYQLAASGSPCQNPQRDGGPQILCEASALCVFDAGIGTCIGPVPEGQACDYLHGPPCEAPARCVVSQIDAGITAGTCQLRDPNQCH